MAFVQRGETGKIIGLFENKQDEFAEEEVSDSEQEVIDFRQAVKDVFERAMTK